MCHEIQRNENQMKSGRIFQGRLWLKKGSLANDDDDEFDKQKALNSGCHTNKTQKSSIQKDSIFKYWVPV
jgi:hypothetical protein